MREYPKTPRMSEDIRYYVRTEYNGDAQPVLQEVARAAREKAAAKPSLGQRLARALAKVPAALGSARASPGGA